ncbi:MAG TPA: hypothetical protein VGJ13_06430 [Pseudonocardiaceae bacterium]
MAEGCGGQPEAGGGQQRRAGGFPGAEPVEWIVARRGDDEEHGGVGWTVPGRLPGLAEPLVRSGSVAISCRFQSACSSIAPGWIRQRHGWVLCTEGARSASSTASARSVVRLMVRLRRSAYAERAGWDVSIATRMPRWHGALVTTSPDRRPGIASRNRFRSQVTARLQLRPMAGAQITAA